MPSSESMENYDSLTNSRMNEYTPYLNGNGYQSTYGKRKYEVSYQKAQAYEEHSKKCFKCNNHPHPQMYMRRSHENYSSFGIQESNSPKNSEELECVVHKFGLSEATNERVGIQEQTQVAENITNSEDLLEKEKTYDSGDSSSEGSIVEHLEKEIKELRREVKDLQVYKQRYQNLKVEKTTTNNSIYKIENKIDNSLIGKSIMEGEHMEMQQNEPPVHKHLKYAKSMIGTVILTESYPEIVMLEYDLAVASKIKSPTKMIRALIRAVFTRESLKNCSAKGEKSTLPALFEDGRKAVYMRVAKSFDITLAQFNAELNKLLNEMRSDLMESPKKKKAKKLPTGCSLKNDKSSINERNLDFQLGAVY
ncbi:DgyrCDS13018 [Dimorphilus gyrociliatus]|uniref:DgyrCDS13018 n=1 Tax=Dimorphilus gyrociliatus TaxID=2664684 RepID=A0A7I8W9E2_9ANNE|nr:DgyrCDS13018 [Dimorphilus gyrociliatus]